MKKVLVAGVGNVLRGDDGFGVRALEKLRGGKLARNPAVRFWESGIAGISLVQELMDRFDALVVLDAVDQGGAPGTLYVIEPDLALLQVAKPQAAVDLHETKPEAVLRMAAALDVLPARVWIVGAQPVDCDELIEELSPEVGTAVDVACARVEDLLAGYLAEGVSHIDETLQILFWLDGEGLAKQAGASDLERWLSLDADAIEPVLARMAELGLVERASGERYRLTDRGKSEGGRRFADEFSDMTKPGHGECGDPDCDCYTTGDPADCRHNVV
jgi:hydrogenase maturation protease